MTGLGCYTDRIIPSVEGAIPSLQGNPASRKDAISKCAKIAAMRGYCMVSLKPTGCHSAFNAYLTYKTHGRAVCNPNGKGYRDISQMYQITKTNTCNYFI